ncbi:MAG TPA: TonB-dependent receptor, partial [Thermoanaerobaculia bacterium]|nr:TonB-dependent receptor [Thermoanaerobaculia bacterium]
GGRAIPSSAGGRQGLGGAFVEELVALAPGWSLAAGVRGDWWHNRATAGAITSEGGGTRRARALSPRLSLRWQASGRWALDLAAYRSFRAPTLNELYRGFRVGDVVTDPNPRLGPERLGGAELGAGWQGDRRRVRATLFTMSLHDPIANVTVATSPGLIRRRRENLGRTRSRGVELEGEAELTSRLSCNASWLLVDATVVRFAADPTLEGRRVAQVPRAQLAASLNWRGDALGAALAARWAGRAFDDDRNNLALGSFLVIDAELARPLPHGLAAFIAVENLFDAEYAVGRTPVETVGAPRLLRLGLRLHRRG